LVLITVCGGKFVQSHGGGDGGGNGFTSNHKSFMGAGINFFSNLKNLFFSVFFRGW
jgi:hypothetical protein